MKQYEVCVIGGGPAGLSTALYTTRLGHKTIIFDRGGGRCAMMADTHNVVGITEDTSGIELLNTGMKQIQNHGAEKIQQHVDSIENTEDGFIINAGDTTIKSKKVVLATGFSDKHPPSPSPRTARGLHYCVHCDAALFENESVYIMGHNQSTAKVAQIMLNFTDDVDILLRGESPEWSEDVSKKLNEHSIEIIETPITGINNGEDGWLSSIEFKDGTIREYKGGFAMYGSEYNNELAKSLNCELNENGSVAVSDHGETTVNGVYAVGDLTEGHNQIPVRLGQGAKAGIDLHYKLRKYPL